MNSLVVAYGSSTDEEEDPALLPDTPSVIAVASPTPGSIKSSPENSFSVTDVEPSSDSKVVEASEILQSDFVDKPDHYADDKDEEMMLLRAGIPPAVTPQNENSEAQQRIERFLRVQQDRGQDFQTTLQDKKEVRNPYILEKVVEYFGIDEQHSNFSPRVFDPHGLPLHEFADALALEQKKRADARAQRQQHQQRGGDFRKL
ncbi:Transcriptional regulator [Plasmopara halstedii]|uniref:Transcriptional regulator n=1 Tax=Plasmopara halstedii TaxID=4781 RepID=A0A0P1AHE8_PLAHL|nr:Transcriptional regulator [Plasmopara halstedii]CEG40145.1 Transcriptional regulator [Plasmopara halstedii]|eukprot:XP_024576514.1 Transcriptional regulator [Plasmopara halstedii]